MKLAGIREIAAILGVSRQRVNQLAEKEGFPEPIDRIAAGPVWERAKIVKWAEQR